MTEQQSSQQGTNVDCVSNIKLSVWVTDKDGNTIPMEREVQKFDPQKRKFVAQYGE